MINTEYQIYDLETSIVRHAAAVGKPFIFIRSYGWNHSDDVEKINKSMEIYKTILPLDLYTMLFQSEWNIIELESMSDIMTFLEDSFPKSQSSVEKEVYIFYALYNEQGQLILSNE